MFEGGAKDSINMLTDFSTTEPDFNAMINKPFRKLNICIVGYGPSGVTAAIGLSRQGHSVTMFEKAHYNYKDKSDKSNEDRGLMYPVNIGQKGMIAVDWLRCKPIFDLHMN